MDAIALKNFLFSIDLSNFTGPILNKELRILSRQKRYYVLRSVYIGIIIFFTAAIFSSVASFNSGLYTVSRMSEAGRAVIITVVTIQFIISQALSVIFLSASISEEMHKRTLGILMTTPISSLQIVLGKFFSRLLVLVLLLALALPLLAVVRVFGGVPGVFLPSSFCIILTSAFFAGSVSLFFSIFSRHGLQTVSKTFLFLLLFYCIPLIVRLSADLIWNKHISLAYIDLSCPFVVLFGNIASITNPRMPFYNSGVLCCIVMFSGAVLFLVLSTIFVRKAALSQITGQAFWGSKRKERLLNSRKAVNADSISSGRILPVKGPPIVWKDVTVYFSAFRKLKSKLGAALFIVIAMIAYGTGAGELIFNEKWSHIVFICTFLLLGLLQAASLASSSITSEKEAGTWELLMTTPLTEKQIAAEKIISSAVRSWPFMFLAIGHIIFFIFLGYIHYAALLPVAAIFVVSFFVASAVGVMISSLCRRSLWSSGVTMFIFISALVPFCAPGSFLGNPLFVTGSILNYTAGREVAEDSLMELVYNSSFADLAGKNAGWIVALSYLAGVLAIYFLGIIICYLIAKNNIRYRIYA